VFWWLVEWLLAIALALAPVEGVKAATGSAADRYDKITCDQSFEK
jgi:hypothetical protein